MSEPGDVSTEPSNAGGTWLTMNEAVALLGRSDKIVRGMIKAREIDGELVTTGNGRQWRISAASVARKASGTPSGTHPEAAPEPPEVVSDVELKQAPEPHPEVLPEPSGAPSGAVADYAARLIEAQAAEITFLRAQIEAANLNAARWAQEAREARQLYAKALPAPADDEPRDGGPEQLQQPATMPQPSQDAPNGAQNTEAVKPSSGAQTGHSGAENEVAATGDAPAAWEPEKRDGWLQRAKVWLFGG